MNTINFAVCIFLLTGKPQKPKSREISPCQTSRETWYTPPSGQVENYVINLALNEFSSPKDDTYMSFGVYLQNININSHDGDIRI